MRVPARLAILCAAVCLTAASAFSDEIRLKDGKKLYGVIVAYEDNMFKIKTDFGFVLVEKDKIASIIPTTPAASNPAPGTSGPAASRSNGSSPSTASAAAKPAKTTQKKTAESAAASAGSSTGTSPGASNVPSTGNAATTPATSGENSDAAAAKPKLSTEPVRPELPVTSPSAKVTPPALKPSVPAGNSASAPAYIVAASQPPPAPKEPEPPANKEQVQGTLYTNFSHGFRMYKAPSWEIIEDARKALPNAIVAMGTSNESTLMVVGQEQSKDSLDVSANAVEKRLREIYTNYHMISRRKTVVGGAPAIEFRYTGMADEHQWSSTLVVVARGSDVLTILGMTYADNDLIQIQENVIARAISSTDFNVH